jgi:hypothetical protein
MKLDHLSPGTRARIRVEDDHWIWIGAFRRGRPMLVNTEVMFWIWCQTMYPIGAGDEVWRTCGESRCVNPDHHEVRANRRRTGT